MNDPGDENVDRFNISDIDKAFEDGMKEVLEHLNKNKRRMLKESEQNPQDRNWDYGYRQGLLILNEVVRDDILAMIRKKDK